LSRAARFVEGDISALPFPDNEFDIAIAHVVFCHLSEPERALDEMIRVAKPGGCVAVFDNAVGAGAGGGWSSWSRPSIREQVLSYEVGQRSMRGRKRLGYGDYGVGGYVPSWMERRGLINVGVRANERVYWIAPPYRSPEQQVAYQNTKERLKEKCRSRLERRQREQCKAGGVSERQLAEVRRLGRNDGRRFERAFASGTAAYASSGPFWCIWGFKRR
jgi:SAM-dependent methyltransferase